MRYTSPLNAVVRSAAPDLVVARVVDRGAHVQQQSAHPLKLCRLTRCQVARLVDVVLEVEEEESVRPRQREVEPRLLGTLPDARTRENFPLIVDDGLLARLEMRPEGKDKGRRPGRVLAGSCGRR